MTKNDFELYPGKNFKDLMKDIVSNADNKREQIEITIAELRDKIQTINDAIVLGPIIKEYIDVSVRNDDALVKLAAVIQRLMTATVGEGEGGTLLSDLEKEQLLKEVKNIQLDTKDPIEVKSDKK